MGIGTSIFLIAAGAILRYGINGSISGINLPVIGLILMIVGVLGLAISMLYTLAWSRRDTPAPPPDRPVRRDREYY
jgi:hypothetical protein